MFKGFREFVLRGNVVDLAVGVVIGAAFGAVVAAFVKDLLTPVIAAIASKPDFSSFYFEVNGAKFLYGDFINAIVSFLLIAAPSAPRRLHRVSWRPIPALNIAESELITRELRFPRLHLCQFPQTTVAEFVTNLGIKVYTR